MISVIILVVILLSIMIWMFGDLKRKKHKLLALFFIGIFIFFVFSVLFVFRGEKVDYTTVPGLISAGKVYVNWLFGAFLNVKSITSNAIKMDWKNISSINSP